MQRHVSYRPYNPLMIRITVISMTAVVMALSKTTKSFRCHRGGSLVLSIDTMGGTVILGIFVGFTVMQEVMLNLYVEYFLCRMTPRAWAT